MARAQTKSSISFKPFVLWELYTEFEDSGMSYKMCFLKINRLLALRRLIFNLIEPMIVDGAKKFKKKLRFVIEKGGI